MNSTSNIQNTLNSFLDDKNLSVIVLKGSWGIGKTYFWDNYIQEKIKRRELSQIAYSYISLFGLNSLVELRSRIFQTGKILQSTRQVKKELEDSYQSENEILRFILGMNSESQDILRYLRRFFNIGKIIPASKQFSPLIDLLEYGLIKNYLICLDDIERKEKSLSVSQLMGLIDELSKRKGCKIVLILNDKTLNDSDEEEFNKYREKVIDLEVEYKPTIKENLLKTFKGDEIYFERLLTVVQTLGISNIRIFKKLRWSVNKVWSFVNACENNLQEEVISHLAVFCWGFFDSETSLSLSFIGNSIKNSTWFSQLSKRSEEQPLTDEEKEWNQIASTLELYPSAYDEQLMHLLEDGYIDEQRFKEEINVANQKEQVSNTKKNLHKAWDIYSDSFKNNVEDLKSAIRDVLEASLDKIDLWDFSLAIDWLEEYGEDVSKYVERYLDLNREKLINIDRENFSLSERLKNTLLWTKIKEIQDSKRNPTIDGILDKIAVGQRWNQEDIDFLSQLTKDEIYEWMKSDPDRIVPKIRRGLLVFKGMTPNNDGEANKYQEIATKTTDALKKIAKENELNRKRVKFIYGVDNIE
jgi:hypothetical protein